jgi:lipopolysaccharide heptosyltransferase II
MTSRVVFAPNWIGDAVMAIPFLRALKRAYPADRLAVIAPPGPGSIFEASGLTDLVLARSNALADALAMRREGFEEAWLLPNSFRAALLTFLAGISERIGYSTDRRGGLLTTAVPVPLRTGHQLRDYDALLRTRGVAPDLEAPRLALPEGAVRKADQALRWVEGRPLALLAPGAAFSWTKRWPEDRFGRLGASLGNREWAVGIAIGPGEREQARRVCDAAQLSLPVLGADRNPVELAALLSQARVVVANDSGPMHLAAAVGTPVVAFFGPTDPGRTGPTGAPAKVLDRYVFCSPCFLKECPFQHECMREITVEMALAAVEEVLSSQ